MKFLLKLGFHLKSYQLKENKVKEGSNYLLESVDWFTIVQEYEECPKDIIKDLLNNSNYYSTEKFFSSKCQRNLKKSAL